MCQPDTHPHKPFSASDTPCRLSVGFVFSYAMAVTTSSVWVIPTHSPRTKLLQASQSQRSNLQAFVSLSQLQFVFCEPCQERSPLGLAQCLSQCPLLPWPLTYLPRVPFQVGDVLQARGSENVNHVSVDCSEEVTSVAKGTLQGGREERREHLSGGGWGLWVGWGWERAVSRHHQRSRSLAPSS